MIKILGNVQSILKQESIDCKITVSQEMDPWTFAPVSKVEFELNDGAVIVRKFTLEPINELVFLNPDVAEDELANKISSEIKEEWIRNKQVIEFKKQKLKVDKKTISPNLITIPNKQLKEQPL